MNSVSDVVSRLASRLETRRLNSPRVRRAILVIAAVVFFAGIWLSLRAQPDILGDLHLMPVVLAVTVAIPVTILFNAYEFVLSARLIGLHIGLRSALETTIVGSVANMLPLPGGTIVRVAALKAAGAGLQRGVSSTLFVALIWIGVAFAYAGTWIVFLGATWVGAILLAIGAGIVAVSLATTSRLLKQWRVPVQIVATKMTLTFLDAWRIYLCFWAIGTDADFAQASALAISSVLGTAVSVVPAGLGIREGVAAAMAPIVGLTASVAFLSVSLSRFLGLAVTAPIAGFLALRAHGDQVRHGQTVPVD